MSQIDNQANLDEERQLLDLLKEYPMPEATAGFYDQALVRAASEGTRRQRNRWVMTGFGSAIAAGVVLAFLGGTFFNAPGIPLEELSVEQWRAVVDINLTGAFFCTQAAFRIMKDQDPRGGRIINNGSISAHVPRPDTAPYTATKHAITGLTRSTSLDGRKYDIACGQIDIGNAATEMTERMVDGVPQADGSLAVEPRMDVTEVGRAVAFMASQPPASNVQFVTIMATKMPFIGLG